MREIIPIHINFNCGSLTFCKCFSTYQNIRIYKASKSIFQKNQISSEKAAKIKSQYASGKFEYFCKPFQYQFPKNHHHQMAIRA